MSSAVAAKPESGVISIPEKMMADIQKLDTVVTGCQQAIAQASPMTQPFIVAASMQKISESITDEMMEYVMRLMNTAHGFKTDRDGTQGKPFYTREQTRPILVQAAAAGAQFCNNEFNIIVGQLYLTKEFYEKAVVRFPGISEFYIELGPPCQYGEKTAVVSGRATWKLNGKPFEIVAKKTDELDTRIIVNAYKSSSPDELLGKARSKMMRRVYSRLTGMNFVDDDTAGTVKGSVVAKPADGVSKIESPDDPEESPVYKLVEAFRKIGISEAVLEGSISGDLDEITETEIKRLRGYYASIDSGKKSAAEVFTLDADSIEWTALLLIEEVLDDGAVDQPVVDAEQQFESLKLTKKDSIDRLKRLNAAAKARFDYLRAKKDKA